MIYPQKLNHNKVNFIARGAMLLSIFIGITLFIVNKITTPQIPWAALTNSGILYVWVTVLYALNRNINIAGHVMLQTIAISILCGYIDYSLGGKGWSINIAIPIIIIIANLTMLILTIVSRKRYVKYAIYQLIICALSMLPVFFITEHMVHDKTLSIVATVISLINFVLTIILCAKDVKEAIIRNFHV